MRSSWISWALVAAAGIAAGFAIAGPPQRAAPVVVAAATSDVPTSLQPPATLGTVAPTTTSPVESSVPSATTTEVASDAPASSEPVATEVTTTTAPPVETETTPPPPAPTEPQVPTEIDRASVRLVVANGDGRYNLVGRNVDRLLALGYVTIDQTDLNGRVERTTLYVRPGFEGAAAVLAVDLQVPGALVVPLPETPVTGNDQAGDIIVVLGPDAVR